ncbi:uncharacterized protein LOC124917139 [Impatiens glandulifera]|uniref:uncharacterized protein LOC124917139 n=1 Tax=Impatiens glandulifera TaxID=253017 RepID=UPI001FB1472C|nr:uncharacterized protein LOC124917139 [Impatiens glandulifera]
MGDNMEEEMHALEKNETWDIVLKPLGTQAVTCKWVYRINRKVNGRIDRYNARLDARGFSQKLTRDEGTCLPDPRVYCALEGSLIYLTIIRYDIAYVVGVVYSTGKVQSLSCKDLQMLTLLEIETIEEVQYKASAHAAQECICIRRLLKDLHVK